MVKTRKGNKITRKVVLKNLKLTKSQLEAYRLINMHNTKELICKWSRQSGKTTFAILMCIEYLFKRGMKIGYVTPTFSLGRLVFKQILNIVEKTGCVKSANATTLTMEMTTGSTIEFLSAEAYKSIRGHTFKGLLVLDEAAYLPEECNGEKLWGNILMPTTKVYKPKVLMISTPCGKQGMFYEHYMDALNYKTTSEGKREDKKAFSCSIYDDMLVSEEEIEEIRNSISEQAFRQEFMVEFLGNALSAFDGYEDCFAEYSQSEPNWNEPLWCGVDFSSVGQDQTIVTFMNLKKQVFQFAVTGSLDTKYRKIAELLDKPRKLIIAYLEANGVGEPMINEVKKLVKCRSKIVEWTTTNGSKEEQVGLLQQDISRSEISFDKKNIPLQKQMGTFGYSISKTKKVTYAGVGGAHDDYVLSLMLCRGAMEDYHYTRGNNVVFIKSRQSSMSMR